MTLFKSTVVEEDVYRIKFALVDNHSHLLNLHTFIESHKQLLILIDEVLWELYPGLKLKAQIEAIREGSLESGIKLIVEGLKDILPQKKGTAYILSTLMALSGVITLYESFKGEKPKEVIRQDNQVTLIGDNNKVTVSNDAYEIYKSNATVGKALQKNFETLAEDNSVMNWQIKKKGSSSPIISVEKERFGDFSKPVKTDTELTSRVEKVVLTVKKPDFYPDKTFKWGFIYKTRNITAFITDNHFKESQRHHRFGRGSKLLVNLRIYYKWDEAAQLLVEANKFEVEEVIDIIEMDDAPSLFEDEPF
jgi:hypothetical protein